MKKKTITTLAAVLVCGCFALPLSACNESADENGTQQGGIGQTTPEKITIDKNTDITAVISERVTEAVWKAALSDEGLSNVELVGKSESTFDTETYQIAFSMKRDGTKIMQTTQGNSLLSTNTIYVATEHGVTYHYRFNDTTWEKRVDEELKNLFMDNLGIDGFSERFAEFTYSEEKNGYELITEKDGLNPHGTYVLKFQSDKLCGYTFSGTSYMYDGTPIQAQSSFVLYGYDNTTVNLPNATLVSD